MMPVEVGLHLRVNVRSTELTVNGLLSALEATAPGFESGLFADVFEQAQRVYLQAVRRGSEPAIACPRCGSQVWVQRGTRPRSLTTSRGRLTFRLRQVSCRRCGATWSPCVARFGLRPWQRLSEELLERMVGLATELSYAKASLCGGELLAARVAPMTIWRAVQQRAARLRLTPGPRPVRVLEVDGTRVPAGEQPRGAPLNLSLQIAGRQRARRRWQRTKRLLGLAVGRESWPRVLSRRLRPQLVVSDGGADLVPSLTQAYPRARHQRCEWHLVYSLGHFLWADGVQPKPWRDRIVSELRALLFAPYPGFWRRAAIWRWRRRRLGACPQSSTLIQEALPQICFPTPSAVRTTGHAEREMRELNRRTDVGIRWSVCGITNLLRLRLARRLNRDDYARLWTHHRESQTVEVQVSKALM
jgi:hypothetical protein